MDIIIPILLTVGFFILQAYLGYKKEQEKAAKRNLGRPNTRPVPPSEHNPEKRDWLEELLQRQTQNKKPAHPPEKPLVEATKPVEQPYSQTYVEPHYETFYKPEKYVPTERPASLLAEYRRLSTYDEDGVLKKASEIRSAKRTEIKRLETEALEVHNLELEKRSFHFDLREAIIIKAILERPYQ